MTGPLAAFISLSCFALVAAANWFFYDRRVKRELRELREQNQSLRLEVIDFPRVVERERANALATSRHVLKGKVSEELLPLLPGFPFLPSDCKFMGAPVDYVVFEGMSDGEITGIVILEVKTGNARLNARQQQIRACIDAGRVRFHEVKMEGVA